MNAVAAGTCSSGRPRASAAATSPAGTSSWVSPTPSPSAATSAVDQPVDVRRQRVGGRRPAAASRSTAAARRPPGTGWGPRARRPPPSGPAGPARPGRPADAGPARAGRSRCARSVARVLRSRCALYELAYASDGVGPRDRGPVVGLSVVSRPPDERRQARMTETARAGGPSLPQERRVVTAIPGPRSTELFARRERRVRPRPRAPRCRSSSTGPAAACSSTSTATPSSTWAPASPWSTSATPPTPVVANVTGAGGRVHAHLLHGHAVRGVRARCARR